jgi:hypothetical protein
MRAPDLAIAFSVALGFTAGPVAANVCDYRPSMIIGQGTSGAVAAAGGTAAGAGAVMKAAGFYTLVHAGSGLTMLGSTMAGASAAGTVGIIAGTAGAIGTVGAVLLAPVTIVVGGVTAVGVGGFEAACYFTDERITNYDEILAFMQHLAQHHPEDRFQLVTGIPGRRDDAIKIWNPLDGDLDTYLVADLYIVNGTLMHRQWGPNRSLGYIAYVHQQDIE